MFFLFLKKNSDNDNDIDIDSDQANWIPKIDGNLCGKCHINDNPKKMFIRSLDIVP